MWTCRTCVTDSSHPTCSCCLVLIHPGDSGFSFHDADGLLDDGRHDQIVPSLSSPGHASPRSSSDYGGERYSRKVFVGGLPPDIDEGKSCLLKMEQEKENVMRSSK